ERVVVMPNGADPAAFNPEHDSRALRERLGLQEALVVGFSGILRPWHGLDLLLEAFARLAVTDSRLHLLIVGDGPIRGELDSAIAAKGLGKRVTITGRVPHAEVRDYVALMDVAVSPRATFYASPMKVLEYMAMGKAIVAPAMDNLRDVLTDGEDALLFEPEQVDSLTEALARVTADHALRAEFGRKARRVIETERTWRHNAEEVIRLMR